MGNTDHILHFNFFFIYISYATLQEGRKEIEKDKQVQ